MSKIWFSVFGDAFANHGQRNAIDWDEIDQVFDSAYEYQPEDKKNLSMLKLGTFSGDVRLNENAEAIYGIEGDYDAGEMPIKEAIDRLTEAGIEAVVYPTHSWSPRKPKWRVLAPLSHPLCAVDYDGWQGLAEARNRLLARLNGVLDGGLAGESAKIAQCYFVGWVKGGHQLTHTRIEGQTIDDLPLLDEKAIWVENVEGKEGGGSGAANVSEDLTLETLLEDKYGEEKTLRDWLPVVLAEGDEFKQLLQASPWRPESRSVNAFMRIVDGRPFVHDNGTSTTHWLRPEDWDECDGILGLSAPAALDLQTHKEQSLIGDEVKIGRGLMMTYNEMRRHLIHLRQGDRVLFDFNPRCVYSSENMGKILAGNFVGRNGASMFKVWQSDLNRKQMDTVSFLAGGPQALLDPDGLKAVNSWVPLYRPEIDPEAAKRESALFASHVYWLFGERAHDFLDWLAHIEQNPGVLPHTSWLHISPIEGTGRSWLANVLDRLWNPYVAPAVDLAQLMDSQFNQKLAGKVLAIVEEIKEGGTSQWGHRQRFKQWMTEDVRTINVKHQHEYKEFNRLRWLMFSNHQSALPLDEFDRRVEVVMCHEKPKHGDYYDQLYSMLKDRQFISSIAVWLSNRDISGFKPGKPASATADKKQLIRVSQKREDRVIEAILNDWPYDLISVATVMGALTGRLVAEHSPAETAKLRIYLNKLVHLGGCQRTEKLSVSERELKKTLDGKDEVPCTRRKKHTLYIVRNVSRYRDGEHTINSHIDHWRDQISEFEATEKGQAWLATHEWKKQHQGFPLSRSVGVDFASHFLDEEDL